MGKIIQFTDADGDVFPQSWVYQGTASTAGTTFTLPANIGTALIMTAHNSTPALNSLWIVRTSASATEGCYCIGLGNGITYANRNVTVSHSGSSVTVKTMSGTVIVAWQRVTI